MGNASGNVSVDGLSNVLRNFAGNAQENTQENASGNALRHGNTFEQVLGWSQIALYYFEIKVAELFYKSTSIRVLNEI